MGYYCLSQNTKISAVAWEPRSSAVERKLTREPGLAASAFPAGVSRMLWVLDPMTSFLSVVIFCCCCLLFFSTQKPPQRRHSALPKMACCLQGTPVGYLKEVSSEISAGCLEYLIKWYFAPPSPFTLGRCILSSLTHSKSKVWLSWIILQAVQHSLEDHTCNHSTWKADMRRISVSLNSQPSYIEKPYLKPKQTTRSSLVIHCLQGHQGSTGWPVASWESKLSCTAICCEPAPSTPQNSYLGIESWRGQAVPLSKSACLPLSLNICLMRCLPPCLDQALCWMVWNPIPHPDKLIKVGQSYYCFTNTAMNTERDSVSAQGRNLVDSGVTIQVQVLNSWNPFIVLLTFPWAKVLYLSVTNRERSPSFQWTLIEHLATMNTVVWIRGYQTVLYKAAAIWPITVTHLCYCS